jgi:undecaprenyl-diphosphatase
VAWILPAVALGIFVLLGAAVYLVGLPYFGLDLYLSHAVQGVSWFGLESLLRGICEADNDAIKASILLAGAALVLVALRARREAVLLIAIVLVAQILCLLAGQIVGRPRPDPQLIQLRIDAKEIDRFPSFPSGHTVHYTVFFGFLGFLASTRVTRASLYYPLLFFFAGLVLLVGPARIYLGAHWTSDVLGGYLLGAAVLAAGINLERRWCRTKDDRHLSRRGKKRRVLHEAREHPQPFRGFPGRNR